MFFSTKCRKPFIFAAIISIAVALYFTLKSILLAVVAGGLGVVVLYCCTEVHERAKLKAKLSAYWTRISSRVGDGVRKFLAMFG